jgi:hypothetical protein
MNTFLMLTCNYQSMLRLMKLKEPRRSRCYDFAPSRESFLSYVKLLPPFSVNLYPCFPRHFLFLILHERQQKHIFFDTRQELSVCQAANSWTWSEEYVTSYHILSHHHLNFSKLTPSSQRPGPGSTKQERSSFQQVRCVKDHFDTARQPLSLHPLHIYRASTARPLELPLDS